jgi:hypothetical protein
LKESKFVKTPSDWCGNYNEDMCEVKIIRFGKSSIITSPFVMIEISGNDDFSLVYDFYLDEFPSFNTIEELYDYTKEIYDNIEDGITIEMVREMGFYAL